MADFFYNLEYGILLKSMIAEEKRKYKPPFQKRLDKGELVVRIPIKDRIPRGEGKDRGKEPAHNYHVYNEPTVTLYDDGVGVVPIEKREFQCLAAVTDCTVRFTQYKTGKFEWVANLKVTDIVFFQIPVDQTFKACAIIKGKIRYYGKVRDHDGLMFGIEILDRNFIGKGTTDGSPYFNCGHKNAVYVSIDKITKKVNSYGDSNNGKGLSEGNELITSTPKPLEGGPHAANLHSSYTKRAGGNRRTNKTLLEKAKDKIVAGLAYVTPTSLSSDIPSKFSIGDHVVLQSATRGIVKGIVRYAEPARMSQESGGLVIPVVGIETKLVGNNATIEKLRNAHLEEEKKYQATKREFDKYRREMERILEAQKSDIMEKSWRINNKDIQVTSTELGKGGWGAVVVGVYREQKVAVKQLHNIIKSDHNLAIMNREISTMSRLRHPNLLLFIGAVLDHPSGNPLIVTEIMDTSLRQAYEKGELTNDEYSKLSILRDTASGLNYLHCHYDEIIHRDVSSANVLLESRGTNKWRAKISDFGSANIARQAFTQQMGAAVYSAPETHVALGQQEQPQTTKMDVYSYGILSCEVLCCQFPQSHAVFRNMLTGVCNSSPSIGQMIQDCMKESPQHRPTMAQVIHCLDDVIVNKK